MSLSPPPYERSERRLREAAPGLEERLSSSSRSRSTSFSEQKTSNKTNVASFLWGNHSSPIMTSVRPTSAVSLVRLTPPPDFVLDCLLKNTSSSSQQQQLKQDSEMAVVVRSPPAPDLAPGPPNQLLGRSESAGVLVGKQPPAGIEIKRCDLMWSGNNTSHMESFTPVENCEIQPVVIISCGSGRFDDDDSEGLKDANIEIHYRWSRGPARAVCFFHPHRTAKLQCTVTLRCFCSYECFRRGHVQLRCFYMSGGKCAVPRQSNEFSYGVPCQKFSPSRQEKSREPDEAHHKLLRQAGLVVDPEQEFWPVVSYSRNYSPRPDDVGHQLKFEILVLLNPLTSTTLPPPPLDINIHPEESCSSSSRLTKWTGGIWIDEPTSNGKRQTPPPSLPVHQRQMSSTSNTAPKSLPIHQHAAAASASKRSTEILNRGIESVSGGSSSTGSAVVPGSSILAVNSNDELAIWAKYDSLRNKQPQQAGDPELIMADGEFPFHKRRCATTACVVPQVPLICDRPVIPIGILAILTNAPMDLSSPQRVIVPGSPLAEALGIGVVLERAYAHKLPKRPAQKLCASSSESILKTRLVVTSPRKKLERQTSEVREKRIALLTENAFASWSKARSSRADPPKEAQVMNGVKHLPQPRNAIPNNVNQTSKSSNGNNESSLVGGGPTNNNGFQDDLSDGFSVMTWNVLADIYATLEAYPYSEPFVLAWNYRKDRILAEILSYNPDIICLQEVQADHFEDFFAPALLRKGYEGLYKQKTSKIFWGSGKHRGGKYVCDGCATFFKIPKFRLVDHFGIEFARVVPPPCRGHNNKADKRLNKDNVALVLCLEQVLRTNGLGRIGKTPNNHNDNMEIVTRKLVVANTHILANPEAPDVKIWQANTLTTLLTEYMESSLAYSHIRDGAFKQLGLVICGDFNSTPDSAVYQLVTSGKCDPRHEELQSSEMYRWLHDIPLGHGLNLRSSYGVASYSRMEANRAMSTGSTPTSPYVTNYQLYEPEFTNYTHQYVGCLDYIFFDDRTLKITGTLDLVKEIQLMEEAQALQLSDWALPSPQRPSDHTPLMAKFEWMR